VRIALFMPISSSGSMPSRGCARPLRIIDQKAFDDQGTRLIQVVSLKLPPGNHGMQDLIVEGGEVRFKKDCDV
jgi:hypothetical protein